MSVFSVYSSNFLFSWRTCSSQVWCRKCIWTRSATCSLHYPHRPNTREDLPGQFESISTAATDASAGWRGLRLDHWPLRDRRAACEARGRDRRGRHVVRGVLPRLQRWGRLAGRLVHLSSSHRRARLRRERLCLLWEAVCGLEAPSVGSSCVSVLPLASTESCTFESCSSRWSAHCSCGRSATGPSCMHRFRRWGWGGRRVYKRSRLGRRRWSGHSSRLVNGCFAGWPLTWCTATRSYATRTKTRRTSVKVPATTASRWTHRRRRRRCQSRGRLRTRPQPQLQHWRLCLCTPLGPVLLLRRAAARTMRRTVQWATPARTRTVAR